MRIATDLVRMFRVMSIAVSPAANKDGDLYLPRQATTVALSVSIDDPDANSPYTIEWAQGSVSADGVSFTAPTSASTSFGPLVRGYTYYVTVTVTSSRGQTKTKAFRVIVGA